MDVRIKRVDFAAGITESVYRRMESERKRVANELRSTGAAEGEKIRADADRQSEVIVAEAFRDAQKVRARAMPGLGPVCRKLWPRPAIRPVLPLAGGLPRVLPQPQRRDGRGPEQRLLQGHARRAAAAPPAKK